MRILARLACAVALATAALAAEDQRIIESSSLVPCMPRSAFSASLFRIVLTPQNRTLTYEINGESTVSSYVLLDLQVQAYGYPALRRRIDPCGSGADLKGLCPMTTGSLSNMKSNFILDKSTMGQVPGIVYYIPDIDGKVRVWINSTETGQPLACVEAEISNGKTVHQEAVSWTLAVITGLCLVVSAFMSGFGHFTTAAHVSARALALISYFQAQAAIGMLNIPYSPIVRAWTQNFQWSMGIIQAEFLESFATWYQRATGGRPARLFYALFTTSVHLQRRSDDQGQNPPVELKTVSGLERVGFAAHIEATNIFLTGYLIFAAVLLLVTLCVVLFRAACEVFVRRRWMHEERFGSFRDGWTLTLKGIVLRLIMMGSLPLIVLSFYELTRKDSTAEVLLAIWTLCFVTTILAVAYTKVWRIARHSQYLHHSPAYALYSDTQLLNKWGFLYVQYKADKMAYLLLLLAHTLVKGAFVGLGQRAGKVQVVALFVLELLLLVLVSWLKPHMDKKTNAFNISIVSVNFVNAFILLLISRIFRMPALGVGVLGVIFFSLNTIFAGVIVIMTIVTAIGALARRDPDSRYPAMADDRHSFVKSVNTSATDELDALGKTARGESQMGSLAARSIGSSNSSAGSPMADATSARLERRMSRSVSSEMSQRQVHDVERGARPRRVSFSDGRSRV